MEKQRVLQLALEGLNREKARIDAEIAELQGQLARGSAPAEKPATKPATKRAGRRMTAEQKAAASARMKLAWAKRKKAQKKTS